MKNQKYIVGGSCAAIVVLGIIGLIGGGVYANKSHNKNFSEFVDKKITDNKVNLKTYKDAKFCFLTNQDLDENGITKKQKVYKLIAESNDFKDFLGQKPTQDLYTKLQDDAENIAIEGDDKAHFLKFDKSKIVSPKDKGLFAKIGSVFNSTDTSTFESLRTHLEKKFDNLKDSECKAVIIERDNNILKVFYYAIPKNSDNKNLKDLKEAEIEEFKFSSDDENKAAIRALFAIFGEQVDKPKASN